MINIVNESHKLLKEFSNPEVAVDMTCGRGRDTMFLAGLAKKVYAFDIQDEAIISTNNALETANIQNVTVIKDNHRHIKSHVRTRIDLAIYNLGYLPEGDKAIQTHANDVIHSLEYLLEIINPQGIIVIVLYPNDFTENQEIEAYCEALDSDYDVSRFSVLNKKDCPYIIKIRRVD